MSWIDDRDQERQDEEARARDFRAACDAEGVPRKGRASLWAEHWSSVVRAAQKAGGYAFHDLRHLVWVFGRVGPEGRATAEAAARLGGWKASVDFVVAECAQLGDADLAAIGKGRAA